MKEKKKNNKKKKNTWMKYRHRVVRNIAFAILGPYSMLRYNIKPEPFKEQGEGPYLVLYNHQTPFDQFFVGMSFKGPIYYLATEDIFSKGFVSSLLRWLVAPIPIKKQTTDVRAILNCIKVSREGGTIAIAPEGNRTYSGRTEYMSPAIASLAKKIGVPIAIVRIEGGYGVHPRWSDCVRRGKMRSYVSRVIPPDEYKDLSDDELSLLIEKELFVDECKKDSLYRSKRRAEYLERAIYTCPFCGFAPFESRGNDMTCKKCGRTVTYNEDKTLSGKGFDFPFEFIGQWYDHQKEFVNSTDTSALCDTPLFTDRSSLSDVVIGKKKVLLRKDCAVSLYGDRVVIDEGREDSLALPFDEITSCAVLGRNKLNIYHRESVYQFKGAKSFNALKYVNLYHRYKNIQGGNPDVKFLGL